jgi:hypothetical protein
MATLNAKKLGTLLKKAKTVGRVEVDVVIDGMKLVLQNLGPDDYIGISDDVKELEELEYLYEWRRAHICRSIVEIDDTDLREVDYIEDEVEAEGGGTKRVRIPRYLWVRDNIVKLFSKEAVDTAFRKFAEAVEAGEKKAAEGVTFVTPDETAEDKFRRQLGESLETASEVPGEIVMKVFDELGLTRKVTAKEAEAADERLSRLASETAPSPKVYHNPNAEEAAPEAPAPAPAPQQAVPTQIQRKPLNRVAPVAHEAPGLPTPVPAPATTTAPTRAAQYAELEQQVSQATGIPVVDSPEQAPLSGATAAATPDQLRRLQEAARRANEPVVVQPQQTNAVEAARILDQPPVAGINPRFRPPPRV